MKDYRFNGPMNVSLTVQEVLEKNYEDYKNSVSIRKGYSVTDKADGERNLLIILKDGEMYLLNRKNYLRKLNAKCVELASSIFDTEYLMKNKMVLLDIPNKVAIMNQNTIHGLVDDDFNYIPVKDVDVSKVVISLEFIISLMEDSQVKNVYWNPSVPPPGGSVDSISLRYKVYVEYK